MTVPVMIVVAVVIGEAFWLGRILEAALDRRQWRKRGYCATCERLDCERERP